MGQNKNIRIKAKINIFIYKDEDSYIVYSPALDLTDYGATSSIALKAFRKSLKIYFEETTRMATLEKDLLDHGWKLQKKPEVIYQPPKINNAEIKQKIIKSNGSHIVNVAEENISIPI